MWPSFLTGQTYCHNFNFNPHTHTTQTNHINKKFIIYWKKFCTYQCVAALCRWKWKMEEEHGGDLCSELLAVVQSDWGTTVPTIVGAVDRNGGQRKRKRKMIFWWKRNYVTDFNSILEKLKYGMKYHIYIFFDNGGKSICFIAREKRNVILVCLGV